MGGQKQLNQCCYFYGVRDQFGSEVSTAYVGQIRVHQARHQISQGKKKHQLIHMKINQHITVGLPELLRKEKYFGRLHHQHRLLARLFRQLEKNILTTSSSTSSTTSTSTAAFHARGLAAAHSRKLSATLGGSTSTHPSVRKFILKTCNFVDINNATIPLGLRGSTTASPLIVIVILRQQLDYVIIDYGRADHGAPDKS
jgi:hypothetical protein